MKAGRDTEIFNFPLLKEYGYDAADFPIDEQPLIVTANEDEDRVRKIFSKIILFIFWAVSICILKLRFLEVLHWQFFTAVFISWAGLYWSIKKRRSSQIRYFKSYMRLPATSHDMAAYFNIDYLEYKKMQFSKEIDFDFENDSTLISTRYETIENVILPFHIKNSFKKHAAGNIENDKDETVLPLPNSAFSRYLKVLKNQKHRSSDSSPSFYLIKESSSISYPLNPNQSTFTVGSNESADVTIGIDGICPVQLIIAKVGDNCLIMDRGKHDIVQIDGVQTRQVCKKVTSRTVIKIADKWLIYESATPGPETVAFDCNLIGIKSFKAVDGLFNIQGAGQQKSSSRGSILFGSHAICDLKTGPHSSQFAALVFWGPDGIYIEKISADIIINDSAVSSREKLNSGDTIELEGIKFIITFEGKVKERAAQITGATLSEPGLAMTVIGGANPDTFRLPAGSSFMVGRSSSAGIFLAGPTISRMHARLTIQKKFLIVADHGSCNEVKVNGKSINRSAVFAGDTIELGCCSLLVHYEILKQL